MPCYNEAAHLNTVVQKVLSQACVTELIMVDDGSTDGSADLMSRLQAKHPGRIRALFCPKNKGKGAAIRLGIPSITQPITLIQDADLEYDPSDYEKLIAPIKTGKTDVVYGTRFGNAQRNHFAYRRQYWANRVLTWLSNQFTGYTLTDMQTCYKVMKTEQIQALQLAENRFGIEPELTAKLAKKKARIQELPIRYHARGYESGKKIGVKDGLWAIYCILKYALPGLD